MMVKRCNRLLWIWLAALPLWSGCIPAGQDLRLPIPFRTQEQFNYCVPATVLMWRLYDGLPAVSQNSIFNWLGGNTNQIQAANAVNHFTHTHDAYWDGGSSSDYREMGARQITAFERQYPSIAVIHTDHTVVLTGGKYHMEGNYKVWDYVRVHDPDPNFGGKHMQWSAGQWLSMFCGRGQTYCDQIVSDLAVDGWYQNMASHIDTFRVYGWDQDLGGPREN